MRRNNLFKCVAGVSCLGLSIAFVSCSSTESQNGVKVDADAVIARYRVI